ncbi:MAG: hypothetical protein HZA90_22115 [Verrucomicrobia bacterium]|nr:hypothetical protein [Verrucomicrobiota bacterium]
MKTFLSAVLTLASVAPLLAQPCTSSYENNAPVVYPAQPNIDACTFINRSQFSVSSTLPFEPTNLRFFTNTSSGSMYGSVGFRFNNVFISGPNSARKSLTSFVNDGSIVASTYLLISASNATSSGSMQCSDQGFLRVDGGNVSLARSGLKAMATPGGCTFFDPASSYINNNAYLNDPGISDLYWAGGTNNAIGTNGTLLDLTDPNFNFGVPNTVSPIHEVMTTIYGYLWTNNVRLPGFNLLSGCGYNFGRYQAFTNQYIPGNSLTNLHVQVVFVPTNWLYTNISTEVRFTTFFLPNNNNTFYKPMIRFSVEDFDIVDETPLTSSVYLEDASIGYPNGIGLVNNYNDNTKRRPRPYSFGKLAPCNWQFALPVAPSIVTRDFFYTPFHRTNEVPIAYAAYSAQVGETTNSPFTVYSTRHPLLSEPTNFAGRVEIFSDQLDTAFTRIRGESFVGIQTRNLLGDLPTVDAPFVNFDIATTRPVMVISNIAARSVNRLFGTISAYSAVWNNALTNSVLVGTNTVNTIYNVRYHVLIVDHCLQPQQPVTVNKFVAKAPNMVVADNVTVNNNMSLDTASLTIGPDGGLTLPASGSWASSNIVHLTRLTNFGDFNIPQFASFTVTQAVVTTNINVPTHTTNYVTNVVSAPYDDFINHGAIRASSMNLWCRNFENTGLGLENAGHQQAVITNSAGMFAIDTRAGRVSNGVLNAYGDLEIRAGSLDLRDTILLAGTVSNAPGQIVPVVPGSLRIWATNSLTDGGTNSHNDWLVTSGFHVYRRPAQGDLLGTRLTSATRRNGLAAHTWAGQDRGVNLAGFSNNLALGWLVLEGGTNSLFTFQAPDATNQYALYVDYFDLRHYATNYRSALELVGTNFTIYFANASIPPRKLIQHPSGRVRWIYQYTGLFSATNLTYPPQFSSYHGYVANTYTLNTALVLSKDINSDWDSEVNFVDLSPIWTPGDVDLVIGTATAGVPPVPKTTLSWNALAYATNFVEYATGLTPPIWQPLTNFVNGPVTQRVTVMDHAGPSLRIYRVREDPLDYLAPTP